MRPPLLAAALATVAGCASAPAQPANPASETAPAAVMAPGEAEKQIATVLDDWHDAAAKADEERYFRHLADDSVFLGTDITERWEKKAFRAYAHPYFAKGKAWNFHAVRRAIVVAPGGGAAWFDEDLGTEKLGPARGSGALVRTPDGWRITLYNLSIPIPNDRFDEVKKIIAGGAAAPVPAPAQ